MSINKWNWQLIGFFALAVVCFTPILAKAVTVEVEDEDEEAAPTPVAVQAPDAVKASPDKTAGKVVENHGQKPVVPASPASPTPSPLSAPPATPVSAAQSLTARVRISDKIGFYYFVKSGYVAKNGAQVHSMGRVVGSFDGQRSFDTPHKTYIELNSSKIEVKLGDLLVVTRLDKKVEEPNASFGGFWVQNLGIVKVIEVDKKRCQVEIKETFFPMVAGDKVRFYDEEIQRWKQAQIKKNLPDHPVKCFVAGGGTNQTSFNQAESIILTAGSSKGVVEGQRFQLREYKGTGSFQPVLQTLQGEAQVYYAGPDYSMAQIVYNHIPIEESFEAVYQP